MSKVALVMAGSYGIGGAVSGMLLENGWSVMVFCRSKPEALLADNSKYGDRLDYYLGDLNSDTDIKAAFDKTKSRFKRLDALVNNSGHIERKPFAQNCIDDWQSGFDTYFLPLVLASNYAVEHFGKDGGSIVNISSFSAQGCDSDFAISSVIRSMLPNYMHCFAREYLPKKIRMNTVLPGFTNTSPEMESFSKEAPINRLAQPRGIASTVLFLLSDEATYISGQSIAVDGGLSSREQSNM